MKYIIGRNETNGQLRIIGDQGQKSVGIQGSVPTSVSRQHMELTHIDGTSDFVLRNLKSTNETFVNGQSVISKRVSPKDNIEMGGDRYHFDWNLIDAPIVVDITPLRAVWRDYKKKRKDFMVKKEKFGAIRGVAGVFSMVGVLATILFAKNSETEGLDLRLIFMSIAVLFVIGVTIIAWRKAPSNFDEQDVIEDELRARYICPNCHHFMGNQPYDVLVQNKRCPYCKAQYKVDTNPKRT